MKAKQLFTLTALALGLAAGSAKAGDVFLTGHDILLHDGGDGYSQVILDYLRGADAKAGYDIAIVGSGVGFASFGDGGGPTITGGAVPATGKALPLVGELAGYGSATYYKTGTGADWAGDILTADVLIILSHTSCGGCDTSDAGVVEINSNAAAIATAFNAGMDIWANSGARNGEFYDFLPPSAAATGPPISGSNFSPTAAGIGIGITEAMTDGDATHNRFIGYDAAFTVFETRNPGDLSEVISIGLRGGSIVDDGIIITDDGGDDDGTTVPDGGSTSLALGLALLGLAGFRRFAARK